MTAQHDDDTSPVKPGEGFDEAALTDYLTHHAVGFQGPVSVRQFKGHRVLQAFLLHTPKLDYTLRKCPASHEPGRQNSCCLRLEREAIVTAALAATGFPVAGPLVHCRDETVIGTPFTLSPYRRGRLYRDPQLPGLDAKERAKVYRNLVAAFARLHELDPDGLALGGFKPAGDGYDARLRGWAEQYEAARDDDIAVMTRLAEWLPQHLPSARETRLLHGDCRLDVVLFEPHGADVSAILDWDAASFGDPFADIARLGALYHATIPGIGGLEGVDPIASGIPGERDLIAAYAQERGIAVPDDWHVHVAIDLYRRAVVAQGAKKRAAATGNAALAKQYGQLVRALANQSWHLVEGD